MKKMFGAVALGGWGYDTLEGGAKVNRSARALGVAFATFLDYKFVLGNTNATLSEVHLRVANRWLWAVKQNGGLYSKLAQGVATMNHVLPPECTFFVHVIKITLR
jgi:aarF domain-containing kinase